ncbi:hypothetical protein FO519_008671 [Halicephalobus sp. NKZ332]|nr:hypothetical protein FO519_008671 [Halicephalobus sp. NKZ332]
MQYEPSPRQPPDIVIATDHPGMNGEWGPDDVDYEALLGHPVLPPNPHFFCCYQRFHITKVAKFLAILYIFIYLVGCCLVYHAGISITVMFSGLMTGSVALTTLYAVFRWKKLCLIPFFLLQILIIMNIAVLIFFLFYAIFVTDEGTSLGRVHKLFVNVPPFSSVTWICILLYGLFLLELFFGYSIQLMLHEYEFIAAVDAFLKTIKKSSSNPSKDGNETMAASRMQLV